MDNFLLALNAVIPFILYMSFGFLMRVFKVTTREFLQKMNALIFKCFFPFIMFTNFYNMDVSEGFDLKVILLVIAVFTTVVILSFLIVPRLEKKNERRGVIIQALFRSNSILFAMPLAASVAGTAGSTLAAVLVACMVPFYNIIAVVTLEYFRGSKKVDLLNLLKKVITNPLIIGALVGTVFLFFDIKLPDCVASPVKAISDMTTPISLFILGGTLQFKSFRNDIKPLAAVSILRLLVIPAIVIGFTMLLGFNGTERFVAFVIFATPVAVSSFSMAANMGGDPDLAGEFVATTTVLSLFTIFFWIVLLKALMLI